MLDKVLRFFACADLLGAAKAATTRGKVIHIHRGCGMSGHKIRRLLRKSGVKVKDTFILVQPNLLRIVVDDRNKAIRVLNEAGIERA